MSSTIKSWLAIALVAALVGSLYVWVNGIPGSTEKESASTVASQTVPAPGPGQKKVVLQNLGMV